MHQCPIYRKSFGFQNQGSRIWGSRDYKRFRTYYEKTKKNFLVFRNQEVMKRGEMQKKFFRFLDRLPYFRSIELLF